MRPSVDDIDDVIDLMIDMYDEVTENYRPPYLMDIEHLELVLPKLLDLDSFIMHYSPGGFILGFAVQHPLWPSLMLGAQEVFYVSKDKRGSFLGSKLLRAFETEAKDKGCNFITVSESSGINPEITNKFYNIHGFSQKGTLFGKEI